MRTTLRLTSLTAAALLVVVAGLAGGAARAATDDSSPGKMKLIWKEDGASDRLQIEPLDLAVGESRTLTTDAGEPVTITRNELGYTIEKDGKTIDLGAGPMALAPGAHFKMHKLELEDGGANAFVLSDEECEEPCADERRLHRIELAPDGETHAFVIGEGDPHVLRFKSEEGGNGFAYRVGGPGPMPLMPFDNLMARIEKSEKFLALDDTTRDIVREVVRDAAPKLEWVGAEEDGVGRGFDVVIERKSKDESD